MTAADLRGEDVLVLAPHADTARAVVAAVEAALPFSRAFGVGEASVTRFALDVLATHGHLLGAAGPVPPEEATRGQLQLEFEASLHLLPLVALRPPNQPSKFAAAVLRHFTLLNVRSFPAVAGCARAFTARGAAA
jgi:hypothetical protein